MGVGIGRAVLHPTQQFGESARVVWELFVRAFAVWSQQTRVQRLFADIKADPERGGELGVGLGLGRVGRVLINGVLHLHPHHAKS